MHQLKKSKLNRGGNMAYWKSKPKQTFEPQEIIRPGDGINTYSPPNEIKRSECVSALNIANQKYPALSVRPGMSYQFPSSSATISTPGALGTRGTSSANIFHVVDGAHWKYWNPPTTDFISISTTCIPGTDKILQFNTAAAKLTVRANSSYMEYFNGTTVIDVTAAPMTRLYTVDDYRLYAIDGAVLKCCAANDITDWTTALDADTIPVSGMQGVGTAITAYNDMVICWSDQTMHILYGNDPIDFQLNEPIPNGCVSDRSVIIHNGILYFMDYDKIMGFTGGLPTEISQKVKTYIEGIAWDYKDKICAGKYGKYILWSIPYGSVTTNNYTLQYDTELRTWYVWNKGILDFTQLDEDLYAVDTSGYIWKINDGTDDGGTAITWEITFGVWDSLPVRGLKVISDIYAIVDLPVSSTLTVSYATDWDGTSFTTLKTFTASADEQNTRIQIPTSALQGINWYRLKFSGTGPCTIFYLEPYMRVRR